MVSLDKAVPALELIAFQVLSPARYVLELAVPAAEIVDAVMGSQVLSPAKNVTALAVPEPNLAVETVPEEMFEALRAVKFAPDTTPNDPLQVPDVIVPTEVKLDPVTPEASVDPVKVPAAADTVPELPREIAVPFILIEELLKEELRSEEHTSELQSH